MSSWNPKCKHIVISFRPFSTLRNIYIIRYKNLSQKVEWRDININNMYHGISASIYIDFIMKIHTFCSGVFSHQSGSYWTTD